MHSRLSRADRILFFDQIISFLTYIGASSSCREGSLLEKASEPSTQAAPQRNKVVGAPILPATVPASRLPKGAVPITAMAKKLMTLPLFSSSTICCRTILLEAICTIIPKPLTDMRSSESHKKWDWEKAMSPNPNTNPATGVVIPSRRAPLLEARNIVPPSAPTPEAAIRKPSVCGPPCKMLPANIGMSTWDGTPAKLISASRRRIDLIGVKLNTYENP